MGKYINPFNLILSFIITFLLIGFLYLYNVSINVLAISDDDQNAIDNAPNGLNVNKHFTIQTPQALGDNNPFDKNYASTQKDGTVLSLASGKGSYGAAWSNVDGGNYININKDQTISAWLYFGSDNSDQGLNSQGMALVLQNDSRGAKAIGAGYQGLGVYGYDKATTDFYATEYNPQNFGTDYIAKTAVQNSMALEFDTQKNDVTSDKDETPIQVKFNPGNLLYKGTYFYTLNGYDTTDTSGSLPIPANYPVNSRFGAGGNFGHIALTYPGLATSYALTPLGSNNLNNSAWKGFQKADTLIHSSAKGAQLLDATAPDGSNIYWHHITFTWKHAQDGQPAQIQYAFNDKYLNGTTNNNTSGGYPLVTDKINVDPSIFGTIKDNKLRWGFTGANGTSSDVHSKLAVLESIPAFLNANVSSTLTDNTSGKVITDKTTDNTVAHGDDLTLNYRLLYDSEDSRTNWDNIAAEIKLPENIDYTADDSGNIATINYKNDTTGDNMTEYIQSDKMTDKELKFVLGQALGKYDSAIYTSANISINGKADNTTDHDITVPASLATFSDNSQISSTSTPKFTVTYLKDWLLSMKKPDPIDIIYHEDSEELNLPTQLSYDKNHNFKNDDPIRYDVTIGNKKYTTSTQANSETTVANGIIPLKSIVGVDFWNIFKENTTQKVQVTAIDKDGITSNTVTYTINVLKGQILEVQASPTLDFQDVNYLATAKYLKRKGKYSLSIISQRNPWKLSVSASELKKNSVPFNGILVYKKADGTIYNLSSDDVPVAENDIPNDELTTTIVSNEWTKDTGPLLHPNGISTPGTYSGSLTWTVKNSV